MITIIAAYDNTEITITPTETTAKGKLAQVPFTISMNASDVFNVTTEGDPLATTHVERECIADFTGTHIVSTKPVGVIVAQSHTSWPCGDNECGDYCAEWLPPVSNWD